MAYTTIPTALIQVGKSIVKNLWQLTKDGLDDHELRIDSLESTSGKIIIYNTPFYNTEAFLSGAGAIERLDSWRAPLDVSLITFEVIQMSSNTVSTNAVFTSSAVDENDYLQLDITQISAGGTLEFDLKKGTDASSVSTIMTTKPSITLTGNPGPIIVRLIGEPS